MAIKLLEDLGRWTWNRIGQGKRLRVRQGETTVTDSVLLEIEIHGGSTRVFKVPGAWEPTTGADYDLFLRRPDGRWARFLIQAKLLNAKETRYDSLGHKVNGRRQIDLLTDLANITGAFPLYSFYNQLQLASPRPYWHCPNPIDEELLGWTVTPASVVKSKLAKRGQRTFEHLHNQTETRPVRCLLECLDCYIRQASRGRLATATGRPSIQPRSASGISWVLNELPEWVESTMEIGRLSEPPREYLEVPREAMPRYALIIQ
jgi:hypothetical protein